MPFFFDPVLLIVLAPAMLLGLWAQMRVKSTFHKGMQIPAPLSGAAAAQHILQSAGVDGVTIEETHGELSDHYDPRERVLRLSRNVFHGRTASAVGFAAHEAGHALQHAHNYGPLALRNAAVPAARVGPTVGIIMMVVAVMMDSLGLFWGGAALFGAVAFFQVVNLPVEFDASRRAKQVLGELGIVDSAGAAAVSSVLNAAAWTYVAATLQAILTLLYYIVRLGGGISRND